MILEVQHETKLEYSEAVSEWISEVRMQPISDSGQSCHSFHLTVNQDTPVYRYTDGFGNTVHHFNLLAPAPEVQVLAAAVVETPATIVEPSTSNVTFPMERNLFPLDVLDYVSLRGPVRHTPLLDPLLDEMRIRPTESIGRWIESVGKRIQERFEYGKYVTVASSPIEDVLRHGKGVCQDFAHLMIAVLRSFDIPARYVSGYIHRPNEESQSHAWCEAWLPDLGWFGFDPTNGCPVNDHFVRVAFGRDFTDVPPNKGIFRGGGFETISVRVATRELDRLPSMAWRQHLRPLDMPMTSVSRARMLFEADEQIQQQQQQQ